MTDLTHDHACGLPARQPPIGYRCESKNSGAVPAKGVREGLR
ncbi:MAG TPA: hypothetical protein VLT33_47155 [Labilithrix sp.]|nr:hypothetical protein [Labilithrix sp.]